jgi:hypothetical protein
MGRGAAAWCNLSGATVVLRYGIRSQDLKEAVALVADAFGVGFALHNSSYRGGDYCVAEVGEGSIYVQPNLDLLDNEPFDENWPPDHHLLCLAGHDDDKWAPYARLLRPVEDSQQVVFMKRAIS